jgi:hypothetical protein
MADVLRLVCCVLHTCATREASWQLLQVLLMVLRAGAAEVQAACIAVAQDAQLLAGQGYVR